MPCGPGAFISPMELSASFDILLGEICHEELIHFSCYSPASGLEELAGIRDDNGYKSVGYH